MTQTTYAVPLACGYIAISLNCTDYTDISGYTQSLVPAEQTRITGEAYTLDGEGAIFQAGSRQPVSIVVNIVYTEDDAGAWDTLEAIFAAGHCPDEICLQWAPRGNTAGYQQYTAQGYITGFQYPPMDAAAGGPIVCTFTFMAGSIDVVVMAS